MRSQLFQIHIICCVGRAWGDASAASTAQSDESAAGSCLLQQAGKSRSHARLGYDFSEVAVRVPDNYDGKVPLPLVLLIHGYSDNPTDYRSSFGLEERINEDQFISVAPEGRFDNAGYRYWSAWGNWCGDCGSAGGVHPFPCHTLCGDGDVEYLRTLVSAMACKYNVDPRKIYAYGQSNGAGMAYRLACDAADLFAGVVAFEGAPPEDGWKPGYKCSPSQPINVLHIHGTADETVPYSGEGGNEPYKGAKDSVEFFARLNRCPNSEFPSAAGSTSDTSVPESYDLSTNNGAGMDTEVFKQSGCASGTTVELWKILDETHHPALTHEYRRILVKWLFSHSKLTTDSALPVPACVDSPFGWKDSHSNRCQDYARHAWCTASGGYGSGWKDHDGWLEDYATNGVSATMACCACGGGDRGHSCTDALPSWKDSTGYKCKAYKNKGWCTKEGGYGRGWKKSEWGTFSDYTNKGRDATSTCCACGGGLRGCPRDS